MNKKAPLIGIKMLISNNKELMLKKGNNAIYSDSIYQSQLTNSPFHSLLFTLNCISQSKGILRTFKYFPMIIKQVENKGNGPITSQRYMNDSIVFLNDLPNIKIIPLIEQKAECILFELCDIIKELNSIENIIQSKSKDAAQTEMDFLDNIIKYYNQEKTKDCDATIEDRNIEEKEAEFCAQNQDDNYQLSILYNRNDIYKFETNREIRIEEPMEKEKEEKAIDSIQSKKKKEKTIEVRYHLRKHIQTPIKNKKQMLNNDKCNDNDKLSYNNSSNNNTDIYLKKKHKRSITILKCPICLEPIDNSSYLDTCKHEFCKKCIDHWATVSSQCPCCKENFKKIIYINPRSRNKTEKKIKKKKFQPDEEEVEQWYANCDEMCFVCKKSDNAPLLLVCDQCNFRICHTFCVGLDYIPDEDFICPECVRKNQTEKKRIHQKKYKKMKKYKQNKILDYIVTKRSPCLKNNNKKYCLRTNSKRKVIN